MNEIIKLTNISFKYSDSKQILDDFSFSINSREFLGIIGPNGSGKTTIIKILTGFLKVHSGSVKLENKNISDLSHVERAKQIAVVPQGVYSPLPYTVREIVEMGRVSRLSKFELFSSEDIAHINEAIESVKMTEYKNKLFGHLSAGEKQRVMIATALAQNPKILFLDEPTASLDIGLSSYLMKILKKLNVERSITVVIVSHDIQLAAAYCERLVLIKNGKIIVDGTAKDVVDPKLISETYGCTTKIINDNGKNLIAVL